MTRVLLMGVPWAQKRIHNIGLIKRQVPDLEIVWDEKEDPFDTWTRLLEIAGDDPIIVLEDDVVLAPEWQTRVEEAIAEHPHDVIQFFSVKKKDAKEGSRWMPGSSFLMNQCHYFPAGDAARLRVFLDHWQQMDPEYARTGHDEGTARWLQSEKRRYWLHVPSLVQHESWVSEINSRRPRNRQSATFEG